jgi:hypothetical protein
MLAILNPHVSRRALDRRATLVLAALALLLVVPLAAFRLVPRPAARQATPSPTPSLARGARAYEERQVLAMMLRDPVRPRQGTPRRIPETHRAGPKDWKRKTVAFELLPKLDTMPRRGADAKSVIGRRGASGGPTVCVSYSLASITKQEGKPAQGDDAAFRMPPPDFHWAMSDPDVAARCTVTVQVMQTAKALSPPTQRLEFILAWEGNGKDQPSSAEEIEQFLRTPELLELLQYLAPLRET